MATLSDNFSGTTQINITLASLASSTAGVGRQSDYIDNTGAKYLSAEVYLQVTQGGSVPLNSPIYAYLIRSASTASGAIRDDGAGTGDAALTINNAPLLGIINTNATAPNTQYNAAFDTTALGELGPYWNIDLVNSTGTAFHATGGSHNAYFVGITKTIA